jgi:RNA polymerase sigma factor (sigma-70 family)
LAARTGSTEDAKEILQEAYVKILVLDRSVAISCLEAYLWRIAVNLAVDRGRRQALDQRFRCALPINERQEFSAEAIVEASERLTIVERAISELPARCLEAFVLHIHNDMTFAEVGREMGISERMAKKHLARALEYLQSCLAAAEETRGAQYAGRECAPPGP